MTASITALRNPPASSARTPWMVAPPGEQTASFSAPGWRPVSSISRAAPISVWAGALHRHGTGEAAGHAAVRHGLDEEVHKGRSAAGHGAAGVHQMVVQGQQPPGACHVLQERRFLLRRDAVAGVEDHALPDGRGGIGHDADQGPVPAAPGSRRSGMVRAAAMDTSTNRSFRAASTGPIFSISPATI